MMMVNFEGRRCRDPPPPNTVRLRGYVTTTIQNMHTHIHGGHILTTTTTISMTKGRRRWSFLFSLARQLGHRDETRRNAGRGSRNPTLSNAPKTLEGNGTI